MINGNGIHEGVSEVASSDLLDSSSQWCTKRFDSAAATSPTSSRYSSCGESEFERYCSANSVMGTPSTCSTITAFNEGLETEFGHARNVGSGDDCSLENFSLGGSLRIELDMNITDHRKIEHNEMAIHGESRTEYGSSGLYLYESGVIDSQVTDDILCWKVESTAEFLGDVEMNHGSDKGERSENEKEGSMIGKEVNVLLETGVDCVLGNTTNEKLHLEYLETAEVEHSMNLEQGFAENFLPCMDNENYDGELDHMEDGISENEHSDSDESMYDNKNKNFRPSKTDCFKKTNLPDENPFLINSSVAFGSNDWDDFEAETQGCSPNSLSLDVFQESKQILNPSSVSLPDSLISSEMERGEQVMQLLVTPKEDQANSNFQEKVNSNPEDSKTVPTLGKPEDMIMKDIPVAIFQVQESSHLNEISNHSHLKKYDSFYGIESEQCLKDIFVINNQAGEFDKTAYNSKCTVGHITQDGMAGEKVPIMLGTPSVDISLVQQFHIPESEDNIRIASQVLGNQGLEDSKANLNPLGDTLVDQHSIEDGEFCENMENSTEADESKTSRTLFGCPSHDPSISTSCLRDHLLPVESAILDLNDYYDEVVHEMEEILLDSGDSPGARFTTGNMISRSLPPLPLRDGGSTASISGTDGSDPTDPQTLKIDGVEVIGAKQKRGDVSFSERLVGVKEYTVYRIKVWSENEQWEVERRYRDFYSLYNQLKSLFSDNGWSLPSPWSLVESKSRKIFGSASPDIIAERSVVIQECLCSVLHSKFSSSLSALNWFLSPEELYPKALGASTLVFQSSVHASVTETQTLSSLGKTISLVVEIRPFKSTKQMLELQHYTCAGCHRDFDVQKTLMKGFAQTFGWGKPRLCEYTRQLFCCSCHTNETAVIPARVLHNWDFTPYPVSQLAKSYLDSIHDQPMLCVSAVNPFLFSKVPALLHVMSERKKIGNMISYVRCPFRKSINRGLGFRRYLVESNDFFALRDLTDLSRGAFAALPVMLETVSRKILEHIVEKCLVCCDVGVSCAARQWCNDPMSLIFPFQESEVERCKSCESVFHKPCFGKLSNCPCGAQSHLRKINETSSSRRLFKRIVHGGLEINVNVNGEVSGEDKSLLSLSKSSSLLSLKSFSRIFTKPNLSRGEDKDENGNIILMGSLPTTAL